MPHILIVEDELPMRLALADCLHGHGYQVSKAENGVAGLEQALSVQPDLLVLDVMMPGLDGLAVCREVRQRRPAMPILLLTAKGQVEDRVTGLDAGADDYLVKPFSTRELLARLRALLRRGEQRAHAVERIVLGEVTIDFTTQLCHRAGQRVPLTARELAILKLLAENRGRPMTREQALETVWGYQAFPTTRTVDNQIASLRAKLEPEPARPRYLVTVHGVGYRLEMTEV